MNGPDWVGVAACVILAALLLLGVLTVALMAIDWDGEEDG